jgi:hypothetical protein
MKRMLAKVVLNTLILAINLQLKNKELSKLARKELENDKADLKRILAEQRRSSR